MNSDIFLAPFVSRFLPYTQNMPSNWTIQEPNPRLQKILSSEMGISETFAQILINRNIRTVEDAHAFLFGGLSSCHDPFLMKGMAKSVERILRAVRSKEKILIYGDYDVDGVTSVALICNVLKEMGGDIETFIPHRLEDGYGLNARGIAIGREKGVKLLITVDCGISSVKEINCAKDHGMDVIITDHHEIKKGAELPKAYAIIDAHQEDCLYPYKGLAGVGVAYKLAKALLKDLPLKADEQLDLVALGTIADVAPVDGENRILVREGLKRLKTTARPGIRALLEVAKVKVESLSSYHVGYILGPRINAVGRVGSADTALELLLTADKARALELAETLDRENRARQSIEKGMLDEAIAMVENEPLSPDSWAIVLAKETWHPGVLGIVASRLCEKYDKPSILISIDGDKGKGSGRSVEGFDLFKALTTVGEHLVDFGGHEGACGVKIKKDELPSFKTAFNGAAGKFFQEREEKASQLRIDVVVPFPQIGLKIINELKTLMPYGSENPEPVFATPGLLVKREPRDLKGGGFKFFAAAGNMTCEAVSFRGKIGKPGAGKAINLAYVPSLNSWGGLETIQLNIKDWQPAE